MLPQPRTPTDMRGSPPTGARSGPRRTWRGVGLMVGLLAFVVGDARAQSLDELRAHLRAGRLAEAEAMAQTLAESPPLRGQASCYLGMLRLRQGRAEEAPELLSEAVKLEPEAEGCHYLLAQSFEALGDLPGAEAEARRAIELRPLDDANQYLLG